MKVDRPSLPSDPKPHGTEAHVPDQERKGVALCLSGGGYRAALFHLGALRRLNELGLLGRIDTLSAVSGGSILTAHVLEKLGQWPSPGEVVENWDERIASPFRRFASHDIRTGPIAKRLLPWNWFKDDTAVEALVDRYERYLTQAHLTQLPGRPKVVFSATDLSYGVNWTSSRDAIGDYQIGYSRPPSWNVARAVAASSCFPPVFNPMKLRIEPSKFAGGKDRGGRERDANVKGLRLSDGGVYDNMGLEPVWKNHAVLLVSDGGATFDLGPDKGLLWRLQRYAAIVSRQASGVRKRWLIAGFRASQLAGAYWGIGSAVSSYEATFGYSTDLVDRVISKVRTDMDVFTEAEQCVLENHGYALADAAIHKHAASLAPHDTAALIPHPDWMDEERVRRALWDSAKVRLLPRRLR